MAITAESVATPDPAPVPAPAAVALLERVKTAGQWHADRIKAAKGDRRVQADAFTNDPAWETEVEAILDTPEPAPEPEVVADPMEAPFT